MANGNELSQKRQSDPTVAEIHERIYVAVVEHRLRPGTKLVEERLAEIFGVSRPRIREVIAQLAHEQVVELYPQRGAFIAKPSIEKANAVLEARRVIEPALIRRLVTRLTPEKLERLRAHAVLEQEARERQDKRAIVRLAGEFHILLSELAGNSELARTIRELSTLTCLVIFLYDVPTATSCRHDEHSCIIDAIAGGDTEAAQELMLEHLEHIEQSLNLKPEQVEVDLREVFSN